MTFLLDALYRPGGMAMMCWTNGGRAHWFDQTYGARPPKAPKAKR